MWQSDGIIATESNITPLQLHYKPCLWECMHNDLQSANLDHVRQRLERLEPDRVTALRGRGRLDPLLYLHVRASRACPAPGAESAGAAYRCQGKPVGDRHVHQEHCKRCSIAASDVHRHSTFFLPV